MHKFLRNPALYVSKKLQRADSIELKWKDLTLAERQSFEQAMIKEVDQVLQAEALEAVKKDRACQIPEHTIMQMRWVLTWKRVEDAEGSASRKAKARLVILGFQHRRLTSLVTASPTVSRMGKALFFFAVAHHQLTLESAGASSAFLQAEQDLSAYARPTAEMAAALGLQIRDKATVAKVV